MRGHRHSAFWAGLKGFSQSIFKITADSVWTVIGLNNNNPPSAEEYIPLSMGQVSIGSGFYSQKDKNSALEKGRPSAQLTLIQTS